MHDMSFRCAVKYFTILFLLVLVSFSVWCESGKVQKGTLYFNDKHYPEQNVLSLDGEWEFYWNKLLSTIYIDEDGDGYIDRLMPDAFVKVPNFWKNYIFEQTGKKTSSSCGTYRLVITKLEPKAPYAILIRESPGTACKVFVNGEEVAGVGKVSSNPVKTIPGCKPIYAEFESNEWGNVELIVQVSNDVHRKGGLWSTVYFAGQDKMFSYYNTQTGVSWLVTGTLVILGVLNLMLFLLTPKHREYLFFAFFVFALGIRVSIAGFSVLSIVFPGISYGLQLKLEYLAIWLAPAVFLLLAYQLYPTIKRNKTVSNILFALEFGFGFITTIVPVRFANRLIPGLELIALLCVIDVSVFLVRALIHRQPTVLLTFASVFVVSMGLIGDVLFTTRKDVMAFSIMPVLLLIFSLIQFLLLALNQSNMYHKQLQLVDDMKKLNDAYLRFVPREFLQLLEKHSMTDVLPGDHVERDMAIIFSQIHFAKSDGTDITPEEQYSLFNTYLLKISPIITKYNGFISKFISHGYMALFPYSTVDALSCSLEIAESLNSISYNCDLQASGNVSNVQNKVQYGIGIHTGKMILGTIGETNRLDDTVISDTVNTASRIESVAEKKGEPIILSQQAYNAVSSVISSSVEIKPLGSIAVKGKSKPVSLYACSSRFIHINTSNTEASDD